jgi:hypothetical protein
MQDNKSTSSAREVINFNLNKEDLLLMGQAVARMQVTGDYSASEPGVFTIRNHSFSADHPGAFTIRNHSFNAKSPGAFTIRNYAFKS